MDLINSDNLEADLKQLGDSGRDLKDVADFCEMNYLQSEDKKAAFEMTKDYAVQSLASVAYQINNLSFNFLAALEGTNFELDKLGQSVNNLAQTIKIAEEKKSRKPLMYPKGYFDMAFVAQDQRASDTSTNDVLVILSHSDG